MQSVQELFQKLESIDSMASELTRLRDEVTALHSKSTSNNLIPEKQLSTELNICTKTLRKYRQQGVIPYLQLGKRILYEKTEVFSKLKEANRTNPSIRISSKLSRAKKQLF